MNTGDHVHARQVYFYQLGLGPANTVNAQGWRLQTMGSIMKKLHHLEVTVMLGGLRNSLPWLQGGSYSRVIIMFNLL